MHAELAHDILPIISKVYMASDFVLGENVEQFEKSLSNMFSSHAVGVSNGTTALEMALIAKGFQNQKIAIPNFSYASTLTAVLATNNEPIFIDVDSNFLIDKEHLSHVIERHRPGACIPVNLFGNVVDRDIIDICGNCVVIEDCAQSFGTKPISDIACYSFFPTKLLGGVGDGGAIVSKDDELIKKVKQIRQPSYNNKIWFGASNKRMNGITAAVLNYKLRYINMWIDRMKEIYRKYSQITYGQRPTFKDQSAPSQYTLTVENRQAFIEKLAKADIETRIYYDKTLSKMARMYRASTPVANMLTEKVISLPFCPYLSDQEIDRIIEVVNEFGSNC